MGKVILDMSISLDGIVAVPDDYRLHDWYFDPEDTVGAGLNAELLDLTGAIITGRRTYDLGASMNGFVDNPYKVTHFVLSHSVPDQPAAGDTDFVFVQDGIESALQQAQAAAGDKAVVLTGGAKTAQAFLKAGLIDELHLHVVPVVFGTGTRLFDETGPDPIELSIIRVVESPAVTHFQYRVIR